MNKLIKYFNENYGKEYGKIAYPRTTAQIYKVYQIIKSYGIKDDKLVELLHNVRLPSPKSVEEKEMYSECIYESVNMPIDKEYFKNTVSSYAEIGKTLVIPAKDIEEMREKEEDSIYIDETNGLDKYEGCSLKFAGKELFSYIRYDSYYECYYVRFQSPDIGRVYFNFNDKYISFYLEDSVSISDAEFNFISDAKQLNNWFMPYDIEIGNSISIGRNEDYEIGKYSSAIGELVSATKRGSHAEGYHTYALGDSSHAEGTNTHAEGTNTHAEGYRTYASGENSHAEGYYTKASSDYQHVQGKYNVEDSSSKYAHIVGNGTSDTKRSNAHTLDWDGNGWYKGKLSQDGTPTNDKDLITKKYLNDILNGLPKLTFVEGGILRVTIGDITQDFEPLPSDPQ